MNKIVEVAEQLGLVAPERIEGMIHGAPVDIFCKIVEITTRAVLEGEIAAVDDTGAAVLASSSIRSDSGCRCWDCRATKLQALARYACLYADRLIVPISLSAMLTNEERHGSRSPISSIR